MSSSSLDLRPHPRLLFTSESELGLHLRLERDPWLRQFVARLRARSDEAAALAPVPYETSEFAEFGVQMLPVCRAVQSRLILHGFLARLTGEPHFEERVWREVKAALAYPWSTSHFLDASEMVLGFAFVYDWLHDRWSPEQRAQLREAMINRVLRPGLVIYETGAGPSGFFATTHSNWNSVCNAGLLAAALAVADDEPALARTVVQYARSSLQRAREGYEPDGATPEGPTYWSYGTDFYCIAALALQTAIGQEDELLDNDALARTTTYRLHVQGPLGLYHTYADAWPEAQPSFAYSYLAQRFGPDRARTQSRELLAGFVAGETTSESAARLFPLIALYLPPPAVLPTPPPALDAFFSGEAQLAYFRSAWDDPHAVYLAFKAGQALANHSQLDLGSFVLDAEGVRWSVDPGQDHYNLPNYFRHETNPGNPLTSANCHEPNRWTYWRNHNRGHSTLTLNGAAQARDAVAPIVAQGSTKAFSFAVADLSGCYPTAAASWKRGVALVDREWVVIRDELEGIAAGSTAEWSLLTSAAIAVAGDGRSATLQESDRTWRVSVASATVDARFALVATGPATAAESPAPGLCRLMLSWTARAPGAAVEVHLTPERKTTTSPYGALPTWSRVIQGPPID
jgi:hypothetical protein